MQEGNVSDNLFGVVVLASDRHLLPPLLLNKIIQICSAVASGRKGVKTPP
jgi:hypothetical protein